VGRVIDGVWDVRDRPPADSGGAFVRPETVFRDMVEPGDVEPGRYHLFVSWACPWAHRTLIARALLGLENAVSVSVSDPILGEDGWIIEGRPLWQTYVDARPDYTGRASVPVLWDRRKATIVNNESREIMRMFATVFRPLWTRSRELSPRTHRQLIDAVIDELFMPVNNGVYRCGFARTQTAYEEAAYELFAALDHWESLLAGQRFLCGDTLTEADICLFTTLFRFDLVYHTHFKCNLRRVVDYPNLWGFVRDVYGTEGVAQTCHADQIKTHYFASHRSINPLGIVPIGPAIDFGQPHDRGRFADGG
jgi:putative glutathione S-transferase